MITFRVEGLPPSYNRHFKINYSFREVYLSPEAHQFKNRIKITMPHNGFPKVCLFKMSLEYHGNFFYKNGKHKKIDMQNMDKLLIDAVFEGLGRDDSHLWELHQKKTQNTIPFTLIKIESLPCLNSEVIKETTF